jgi:hypothetical protein
MRTYAMCGDENRFAAMVERFTLSAAQKFVFEPTTTINRDALPPPYRLKLDSSK